MKRTVFFLTLIFASFQGFAQGTIVEDTVILQLGYDEIDSIIVLNGLPSGLLAINNDIDVHRVIYETPDVDGSTTVASGLVLIPVVDSCSMPMLAYLHGTKIKKTETFYYLRGEWQLGVIAAASGYAMVMPDYIGLGASPGIHPYQHTESQATASIDIMRVCRTLCEQDGRELNGQLFIMGYSQGGHATMGTHRMIQEELNGEFEVTASAPGAGAYDLSDTQLNMVASFDPYSVPGYLPYLIQSYQHVYGDLYDSIQQIYVPPYDQTLLPLLQGDHDMWEVDQAMPPVPRDIIQPDYADAFFSDTTHPAYLALKDNDVYEWVPEAPVMFNYCSSDEQVSYVNTLIASNYMISAGATDIQVIERDTELSHYECAQPSLFLSKIWFDGMANFCEDQTSSINDLQKDASIRLFPNPTVDGYVNFTNKEPILVRLLDLSGRELQSARKLGPSGKLDLAEINPGFVLIEMLQGDLVSVQRLVVQ